jgi:hypothetical protein
VQSGNRRQYLVNRIARDRTDVLERMKAGEFETVREAARAAGILPASGGEHQGRQLRRPAVPEAQQMPRAPYDIYAALDLGPGGTAISPSTETRRGVRKAIQRKLGR